jgi:hypothetical protein
MKLITPSRFKYSNVSNLIRFPIDFMIQLSKAEAKFLRSQFVTLEKHSHYKYLPYVFTEHGALMLASILNSETAVEASVQVVRSFVRLREMLISHSELSRKLSELEKKYDSQFKN